jgi:hypothetical protein
LPNVVVVVIKSRKCEIGWILKTHWRKEKFTEAAMQNKIFNNTIVRAINLVTNVRVLLKTLNENKITSDQTYLD